MYYTLNEFTEFSRMIQKLKTDVWLWSLFQYYEQHGRRTDYRNQPHGSILNSKTAIPRPLITNSILAQSMFFHSPAFTFHHITRENIRPLHAGQTEHRRRPSLHDKQSGLSGERLKEIEKETRVRHCCSL